jgi:hypothetical protein
MIVFKAANLAPYDCVCRIFRIMLTDNGGMLRLAVVPKCPTDMWYRLSA